MNGQNKLPETITSLTDFKAIERNANRFETPCGEEGKVIWHSWGDGRPMLLLHGGSGSWTHWIRNIGALVNIGYRILAPDLPGFGDSALMPDGRDADVMPAWLELGLTKLIGNDACQVVGFSYGAMVGTLLANEFPARVNGLVLVGAPALSNIPMPRVGLRPWEQLAPGPERTAIHSHNLRALMLARDESIDPLALTLHAANLERDRLKRRRLARTDIVVRTLPGVLCPVSGIWGAQDAVYQDRFHTIEPGLSAAPNFRSLKLLTDSGHWTQYEDAAAFNAALLATLDEQIGY